MTDDSGILSAMIYVDILFPWDAIFIDLTSVSTAQFSPVAGTPHDDRRPHDHMTMPPHH